MNVLIIGSGGREHVFAWKISQSPLLSSLYVSPGNAGTASIAQNVPLPDHEAIGKFCLENSVEMVVVGPEAPLVEGIADYFAATPDLAHIHMIGPGKAGAQLEGSKDFAKQFMAKYGIPTGFAKTFTQATLQEGLAYLAETQPPYVLKADGLAAGKGVLITPSLEEAQSILKEMLGGKFGEASAKVLVEQFLDGIELSVFVLTDGEGYVTFPEAKDYKRIGEGDTGLNTGGMGAVSPVPFAGPRFMEKVQEKIIKPTLAGLKAEGIPYTGFIFFGLIKVGDEPYVIEYNVRMGDPETEVVFPRLQNDLLDLLTLAGEKRLSEAKVAIDERVATTVMLVSGGYPGSYEKGKTITGLEGVEDAIVFHAGTATGEGQTVVTNGGRVLAVTALANNMLTALRLSLNGAEKVDFEGKYFRKDIGFDL